MGQGNTTLSSVESKSTHEVNQWNEYGDYDFLLLYFSHNWIQEAGRDIFNLSLKNMAMEA